MEVGLLRVASRRDPAVPGMIMTGEMEDEVTNSSRDISMEKRIMFLDKKVVYSASLQQNGYIYTYW